MKHYAPDVNTCYYFIMVLKYLKETRELNEEIHDDLTVHGACVHCIHIS